MMRTDTSEWSAGVDARPLRGLSGIVTGSTSGIGLGVARALARAGANVMLNGFGSDDALESLRRRLSQEAATEVILSRSDVSLPDQVEGMVAEAESAFGSIDVLVNNAGVQHVAPIEAFPLAQWNAVLAINLSAAFYTTRAVFGRMKENGNGRIINIASAHGLVASPFKSAYVASKHGLIGLTKVTALEGAEAGVTCNAICPGYVWTPLVEKQIKDQAAVHDKPAADVVRDILLAQQPNKRFATVEEIGALAVFLCTEAAKSITGAALPIDGGWTAH
jgi:3-hydroxybutyrate dehydrogenase